MAKKTNVVNGKKDAKITLVTEARKTLIEPDKRPEITTVGVLIWHSDQQSNPWFLFTSASTNHQLDLFTAPLGQTEHGPEPTPTTARRVIRELGWPSENLNVQSGSIHRESSPLIIKRFVPHFVHLAPQLTETISGLVWLNAGGLKQAVENNHAGPNLLKTFKAACPECFGLQTGNQTWEKIEPIVRLASQKLTTPPPDRP